MKRSKVYKVVSRQPNNSLTSAVAKGIFRNLYSTKEVTKDPLGIMAFDSEFAARRFINSLDVDFSGTPEVWEAEGYISKAKVHTVVKYTYLHSFEKRPTLREFKSWLFNNDSFEIKWKGTIFCSSLRLVRRIK